MRCCSASPLRKVGRRRKPCKRPHSIAANHQTDGASNGRSSDHFLNTEGSGLARTNWIALPIGFSFQSLSSRRSFPRNIRVVCSAQLRNGAKESSEESRLN